TQAISEALCLYNLGLDAATSAAQSVVLVGLVAGAWLWTRRSPTSAPGNLRWRVNPLEAAGLAMIITNFGLIFAARGPEMTYDNLRALGWYDAIPELGAVLFGAGWWSGRITGPPPRSIELPERRELLGAAVFAVTIFLMQAPRAWRVTFEYDG